MISLAFNLFSHIWISFAKSIGMEPEFIKSGLKKLAKGTIGITILFVFMIGCFMVAFTITNIILGAIYFKFTPHLDITRSLNVGFDEGEFKAKVLIQAEDKVRTPS